MSAGQSRELAVGGVRLHVEEHGSGPPVLLIHGWPDSGYLWRHQIPCLAGHGFRVIGPDMRGLGRSDCPPEVADYALAKGIGDVSGVMEEGCGDVGVGLRTAGWADVGRGPRQSHTCMFR